MVSGGGSVDSRSSPPAHDSLDRTCTFQLSHSSSRICAFQVVLHEGRRVVWDQAHV